MNESEQPSRRAHRGGLEQRALLAAAVTGILVGAALVASRGVVDLVGPASLAFLRYAVGVLCLAPVVALRELNARDCAVATSCQSACLPSASSGSSSCC